MYSVWTTNAKTEEEKKNFEDQIKRSKEVLDRLADILKQDRDGLETVELSPKAFDNPNWAERQAFTNGYKAALNKITKIINIDQKEKQ